MGFKPIADLDCGTTIQLGGKDAKTNKPNAKILQGYYIGNKSVTTKFGPGKIHIFQTETGNVGVWGKTDMDNKLASVTPGFMVRVSFTGTVPSKKGNPMWKYKVEIDQDNDIVDELAAAPEQGLVGDQEPVAAEYEDDDTADLDPGEEGMTVDEVTPTRPTPPQRAATAPNAARQAQVQALLRGGKRAA